MIWENEMGRPTAEGTCTELLTRSGTEHKLMMRQRRAQYVASLDIFRGLTVARVSTFIYDLHVFFIRF
ncbi:hypothetical protein P8452_66300 [Trifolium repens]|nr:hypothetical protein QL285_087836 [Trifolium repens]WJX83652.1 hypothetical protein P8452_66300 [Trifolium repens]